MAQIEHERYGFSVESPKSFDQAVASVKETLKKQGFGILSEIDVAATLKQKLDVEREPYLILGACNPQFAHEALQTEEQLGLLLPCNVTIRRKDGKTLISAIDARTMMSVVENNKLTEVAGEVNTRLQAAIGEAA
ncbi:MAG TPA: DUF302 domain-containing protein [Verrucomicrobiae bacterium]|jgi:uncharacterized protein (DUF302 family)|nr:DUF302 domain-containing protein [Verrucomicrobiae bacterium]